MSSTEAVTARDYRLASEMAEIVATGRTTLEDREFTIRMDGEGILGMLRSSEPGEPVDFSLSVTDNGWDLLGVTIPLGPATFRGTASLRLGRAELRREAAKLEPEGTFPVEFAGATVHAEFADWLPDRDAEQPDGAGIGGPPGGRLP